MKPHFYKWHGLWYVRRVVNNIRQLSVGMATIQDAWAFSLKTYGKLWVTERRTKK